MDITTYQLNQKHVLKIESYSENFIENMKQFIQVMFVCCNHCGGEVTPSDDMFLCMSGCGHVKGKTQEIG